MWTACPPLKHPIVPDPHGYLAPAPGLPIANILAPTLAPYSPYGPLATSPEYPITPQPQLCPWGLPGIPKPSPMAPGDPLHPTEGLLSSQCLPVAPPIPQSSLHPDKIWGGIPSPLHFNTPFSLSTEEKRKKEKPEGQGARGGPPGLHRSKTLVNLFFKGGRATSQSWAPPSQEAPGSDRRARAKSPGRSDGDRGISLGGRAERDSTWDCSPFYGPLVASLARSGHKEGFPKHAVLTVGGDAAVCSGHSPLSISLAVGAVQKIVIRSLKRGNGGARVPGGCGAGSACTRPCAACVYPALVWSELLGWRAWGTPWAGWGSPCPAGHPCLLCLPREKPACHHPGPHGHCHPAAQRQRP